MKHFLASLALMSLLFLILIAQTVSAAEKTIFINGETASKDQINQIENAFGVSLVNKARFRLDYLSGDFFQIDDNIFLGNIYEYSFSKELNKNSSKENNIHPATAQDDRGGLYKNTFHTTGFIRTHH